MVFLPNPRMVHNEIYGDANLDWKRYPVMGIWSKTAESSTDNSENSKRATKTIQTLQQGNTRHRSPMLGCFGSTDRIPSLSERENLRSHWNANLGMELLMEECPNCGYHEGKEGTILL